MLGICNVVGLSWDHVGSVLGHAGPCWAMLGLCCAHVGLVWVYVGPILGYLVGICGVPWRSLEGRIEPQTKNFLFEGFLRFILDAFEGLCWANVGPFWVYVGGMLGHLVGFVGFHGSFWREKTTPNTKLFVLRVILGDFLGLCPAKVGPFWVYVGVM